MTEYLPGLEGERRKPELSQWFSPPETAKRIVEFALAPYDSFIASQTMNALEPSAGRGALAILLRERLRKCVCVELDPQNAEWLTRNHFPTFQGDFLEMLPDDLLPPFSLAVMNPPFEGGQTERHLLHALKFAPRVVCHCPLTTLAGQARGEQLWSKVHLHRLAICSSRPKYGEKAGMTDMCTVDVSLRTSSTPVLAETQVEWWP